MGLLQSVEYLNPYTNPEGATQRRNIVLQNMASEGYLPQEEADHFVGTPLGILPEPKLLPDGCIAAGNRGFFCDYALRYLEGKGLSQEEIERGSYTITTTLQPHVQDVATEAVRANVSPETFGVAQRREIRAKADPSRGAGAITEHDLY